MVTAVPIVEAAFVPLIVATAVDTVVLAAVAMAVAVAGEGSALYETVQSTDVVALY